ncbi:rhsD domain protein [Burkholderia pseudomallei MSHR5609]|nr:rhsD domain protein [Burkholderia pseudomallei MSHR5609]
MEESYGKRVTTQSEEASNSDFNWSSSRLGCRGSISMQKLASITIGIDILIRILGSLLARIQFDCLVV